MTTTPIAITGNLLTLLDDPMHTPDGWRYIENGMLVIEQGHITAVGKASTLKSSLHPDTSVIDHSGSLVVPGFIDTHIHYPQCEIIASYGSQLLDWLNTYTYPAESRFDDPETAENTAEFFLDQLLSNGTTTALVFGTVHSQSVNAFFSAAEKRQLRMICGKVLMDRNAPAELCDSPDLAYDESLILIKRWHDRSRLGYAITPRFAPTSSDAQLQQAGKLKAEFPDVHLHTHLSENIAECAWVAELFPTCTDYVDVYDHFGLLGSRSVFAHSIHLAEREWRRLAATGSSVAHCPTSNLFIGSGLFNLQKATEHGVKVGIGTDVGGGDSFSLLRTLNEAYKVQQLQDYSLAPLRSLYLATLGGARALDLQKHIGSLEVGKEADIIILDPCATPLLRMRTAACREIRELLFVLLMLGDDRAVSHTYILGKECKTSNT